MSLTHHSHLLFQKADYKYNLLWKCNIIAKDIYGELILTKVIDSLWTPVYCLFREMVRRIFVAHINHLFNFVLIFSTAAPNRCYSDSKTLNISVALIGLFVSLRGSQQVLIWLVMDYSRSDVSRRWYFIH